MHPGSHAGWNLASKTWIRGVNTCLPELLTSRTSLCFCGHLSHSRTALSYNYSTRFGLKGGNRLRQGWDSFLKQNVEPSRSVSPLQNRKLNERELCVNTHSSGNSVLFRNIQWMMSNIVPSSAISSDLKRC